MGRASKNIVELGAGQFWAVLSTKTQNTHHFGPTLAGATAIKVKNYQQMVVAAYIDDITIIAKT